MGNVQWVPWWFAVVGFAALIAASALSPLSPWGFGAGIAYLVVSNLLLALGLRRRGAARFGQANIVTATRSVLVGLITAIVVSSFTAAVSTPLLVTLAAIALALDGIDGYVARRTSSESELGAQFDMEVDAFLLLVLSVCCGPIVGWWVLAFGLMRYAFVAAGLVLPWMRETLPPRFWRKAVTAICGIALTVVASRLLPEVVAAIVALAALALLVESFARDVTWLVRTHLSRVNRSGIRLVSTEEASTEEA
ncbi:CDP-alcohol phosphatidyltransferase family protein [Microbacterium sp.]|jgi:phosphatidylglycerophosphate synthase|uniref:CDP-alcohol phosphatidyltransferase family protein n=1 Tax=Microbacterium sp. TaxID=51671 RepID=UPI002CA3CE60|nr:CDP-alcohol phosphatidyltransferase family protein [Microbacterium sp.]HET6302296.1 CDP-alcohol phosphatidyltransferase family protein [Microbacterium sp.]HWL77618.1 CDP-alcohol phosphatidyltransferase family protein [Microbacterium sp.]